MHLVFSPVVLLSNIMYICVFSRVEYSKPHLNCFLLTLKNEMRNKMLLFLFSIWLPYVSRHFNLSTHPYAYCLYIWTGYVILWHFSCNKLKTETWLSNYINLLKNRTDTLIIRECQKRMFYLSEHELQVSLE